jgi:hypothetical protein
MYGAFEEVAAGPARALRSGADMLGTGLCPEGIEQNPAAYALMNEWAFRRASLYPTPTLTGNPASRTRARCAELDMELATPSQGTASAQRCDGLLAAASQPGT